MAQMSSMWQIKTHEAVMWSHQGLIDLQVRGASTQTLHIDSPPLGVEMESFERSLLTCELDGINVLVSSVVSCTWVAFGVFVRHRRSKGIEDGTGGEIFGGDEHD